MKTLRALENRHQKGPRIDVVGRKVMVHKMHEALKNSAPLECTTNLFETIRWHRSPAAQKSDDIKEEKTEARGTKRKEPEEWVVKEEKKDDHTNEQPHVAHPAGPEGMRTIMSYKGWTIYRDENRGMAIWLKTGLSITVQDRRAWKVNLRWAACVAHSCTLHQSQSPSPPSLTLVCALALIKGDIR